MVDVAPAGVAPSEEDIKRSQAIIADLREGKLPQMVDWFDPIQLAKVGIRSVISKAIGSYADQRPIQAAMDWAEEEGLLLRHDYSEVDHERHIATHPKRADQGKVERKESTKSHVNLDENNSLWVDFIADLGDGFEATYAMAYLLAKSKLKVAGVTSEEWPNGLPAGEFLIFGGDLAYPDATVSEYNARCIAPYEAAFHAEKPKRKLFFISGNHDWYDGLAAFTSVFCGARDRLSHGKGKTIGGWQCEQRRSYFALRLPYNWWIWGIDHALNDTIDELQTDYFELMSSKTNVGDKIIIILHAPVWQQDERDPNHLLEISKLARNNGAEVVAVIAGDLHFYSRYHTQTPKLDLQLIISGGGGAFAHPTHQEPLKREVLWATPSTEYVPLTKKHFDTAVFSATAEEEDADEDDRRPFNLPQRHIFHSRAHFYPSRLTSRLLALKNLWLPLHNRRLALFIGVVYMAYAWVFQTTVADPTDAIKHAQFVQAESDCKVGVKTDTISGSLETCVTNAQRLITDKLKKYIERDPYRGTDVPDPATKVQPKSTYAVELNDAWEHHRYFLGMWMMAKVLVVDHLIPQFSLTRIAHAMLDNPVFFLMVMGLWVGLIYYVDAISKIIKLTLGSLHFFSHFGLLLLTNAMFQPLYQKMVGSMTPWVIVAGVFIYTLLMLMIGGFIGGAVFGLYSATTSFFRGMHMDAFSALGINDYKNFLRMRFDKSGGLTIYAIGLKRVPSRKGWRSIDPKTDQLIYSDHSPLIVPVKEMKPHLIDKIAGQPVGKDWKWDGSA